MVNRSPSIEGVVWCYLKRGVGWAGPANVSSSTSDGQWEPSHIFRAQHNQSCDFILFSIMGRMDCRRWGSCPHTGPSSTMYQALFSVPDAHYCIQFSQETTEETEAESLGDVK